VKNPEHPVYPGQKSGENNMSSVKITGFVVAVRKI
jgi:hypothetical protein